MPVNIRLALFGSQPNGTQHVYGVLEGDHYLSSRDPENPTPPFFVPRTSETRVLRLKEVCKVTGLRRSEDAQPRDFDMRMHAMRFPDGIGCSPGPNEMNPFAV
jgi:hypothetical protein